MTSTAQINRLRALLREAHDDSDRQLARAALPDVTLTRLGRRCLPRDASACTAVASPQQQLVPQGTSILCYRF